MREQHIGMGCQSTVGGRPQGPQLRPRLRVGPSPQLFPVQAAAIGMPTVAAKGMTFAINQSQTAKIRAKVRGNQSQQRRQAPQIRYQPL